MLEDFSKPLTETIANAEQYIEAKTDEMKLRSARGLAVGLSRFLTSMILVAVTITLLSLLALALVLVFGDIVGSYALGTLIVAGIWLILLIVLIAVRKKLFVKAFIKLFMGIFFSEE